jgi:hypothetical protein
MCNMLSMPRRTRASGVVVWDDRDAGDATVLEGGFGDHGCFCSWFEGEWESRAGKTLRAVAGYLINFKGVVNVSGQVRQSRAPGLMRLCYQDDTIGVTTTCDYVSGECSCATYTIAYAPPVTSSAFTYIRVMQVARGSCSAEA